MGVVVGEIAAAAEVARLRMHDGERERDGDRRVGGVAAAAQDREAGLGGGRVGGGEGGGFGGDGGAGVRGHR
jgi:hypothetical protein